MSARGRTSGRRALGARHLLAIVAVVGAVATGIAPGLSEQPAAATVGCAPSTPFYDRAGPSGTVYRLYRAYFLRHPDRGGYDYWLGQHVAGYPLGSISDNFARSAEFQNRYGSATADGFLEIVYSNVLGRAPDRQGLEYWRDQMQNRGMPRGHVMLHFSDSSEYRNRTADGIPPGFAPAGALAAVPGTAAGALGRTTGDIYGGFAADPDDASVYVTSGRVGSVVRDHARERVLVQGYATSNLARTGDPVVISTAGWARWGGHLAADDGSHILLLGRDNLSEQRDRTTIQIRRYDANWRLLATGEFTNDSSGIYQPFAFGSPKMAVVDGRLVIHMARLQFITDDGLRHQLNLTLIGDVDDLVMRRYEGRPYASHSFNQLLTATRDGRGLVFVDHADVYPRGIQVGVTSVADAVADRPATTALPFEFDGSFSDDFYQYTGTAVTGIAALDDGALIIGNSVRHQGDERRAVDQNEKRNLFALTVNSDGSSRELRWLTAFPGNGANTVGDARLVPLDDGRFVVLYPVGQSNGACSLGYQLLDSSGRTIASKTFPQAPFNAVSEVVVAGTRLHWVATHDVGNLPLLLMGLDITNPTAPAIS